MELFFKKGQANGQMGKKESANKLGKNKYQKCMCAWVKKCLIQRKVDLSQIKYL